MKRLDAGPGKRKTEDALPSCKRFPPSRRKASAGEEETGGSLVRSRATSGNSLWGWTGEDTRRRILPLLSHPAIHCPTQADELLPGNEWRAVPYHGHLEAMKGGRKSAEYFQNEPGRRLRSEAQTLCGAEACSLIPSVDI